MLFDFVLVLKIMPAFTSATYIQVHFTRGFLMEANTITADTLTPPTVGRLSVMRIGRQSAHFVCDFSCRLYKNYD